MSCFVLLAVRGLKPAVGDHAGPGEAVRRLELRRRKLQRAIAGARARDHSLRSLRTAQRVSVHWRRGGTRDCQSDYETVYYSE